MRFDAEEEEEEERPSSSGPSQSIAETASTFPESEFDPRESDHED
jgi:hypothetical protein